MDDETRSVLTLDPVDEQTFRGYPARSFPAQMFGGQLVSHAVAAAVRTMPADRVLHSVHSHFLRPGRSEIPVEYRVDPGYEGRTRSTCEVTATQADRLVFRLFASFHTTEDGPEHQMAVISPPVGEPATGFPDPGSADDRSRHWFATVSTLFPFDVGFPDEPVRLAVGRGEHPAARQRLWLRWSGLEGEQPAVHLAALAYMSDVFLLSTALFPHGRLLDERGVRGSSLDHAIWFHRPPRADEWLLHEMQSSWAGGGRAMCNGQIFDRTGRLVATVVQEGMLRIED